jgi:hypothetical protein
MTILYQNKWAKIVQKDTFYILQSKSGKYNDQYFTTIESAFKAIGINIYKNLIKY